MTRKEDAINTLKENCCAMCAYGSQDMESCDIRSCDNKDAIKALEQDPTTKNNLGVDCVDRQAAITFVCKNTEEILKDTMPLDVKLSDDYLYENVAKIMRNPKILPSVTPQEPILDKIFNIVFPLSIMSTPELEHEAIMQIAEMLEPPCLPESEVEDGKID